MYQLTVKQSGIVKTFDFTDEQAAKKAYHLVKLSHRGEITAKCLTVKRGDLNDVLLNDYL